MRLECTLHRMTRNLMLSRTTPEAQGVSSSALLDFVGTIEQNIQDLHSFMLLRHGHVIAEGWWAPYAAPLPHMLFSLSKSFTSTAIGLLVGEGRLSVDDKVISFFPDDLPAEISPDLADMSVHDLLSMSTGHDTEPSRTADDNWARVFLAHPVQHMPGTHFLYNSMATYMCSAILQKITGLTLLEYLTPRLFAPLGIENPTWESCPRGINTGGWGLSITTEDIAAFGQLYLQQGLWQGVQWVPANWVAAATRKQVRNDNNDLNTNPDWSQGYGYQFWRCRHNIYRGDGAFGQYCIVMPEQDAVLAITSGVSDMQVVLNVVWDKLLPALGSAALPEASATHKTLSQKLTALSIPTVAGKPTSATAARVSGKTFVFEPNERNFQSIKVAFGADQADQDEITLHDQTGERLLVCGHGRWVTGSAEMYSGTFLAGPRSVASGSGAWTDDITYDFKAFFRATPYCLIGTLKFDGDSVIAHLSMNVSFIPGQFPIVVGRSV